MKDEMLIIGIILIVIGIPATFFYCLGIPLIIIGIIILVIGATQEEQRPVVQYYQGYPPQPIYQQQPTQPGVLIYCPYCGTPLGPGYSNCPRCGRALPKQ